MRDPERLIVERASELEGELLRLTRDDVPTQNARLQARAALASTGAKSSTLHATSAFRSAAASKWVVCTLAAAGVVAGVGHLPWMSKRVEPIESVASVAPEPVVAAPAPPPSQQIVEAPSTSVPPEAVSTASRTPPVRPSREPVSSNELAEEVAALDRARHAVEGHEAARALELLRGYQKRFPRGYLGREASLLRIEALVENGQRDAAVAAGRKFLSSDPTGPSADKVRRIISGANP
jgi:hypothetical protein